MAETARKRFHEVVRQQALEITKQHNDALEEYCEKALQSGYLGVLVIEKTGGVSLYGLSSEVPYGHIHRRKE